MNRIIKSFVLAAFATGAVYAGKSVVPAVSPVAEVEDYSAWYVGAGIVLGTYEGKCPEGCPYEDDTWGPMVRIGYDFNQYVGIEGRYLRSLWGEGANGGERFEHYGLYLKPMLPVGERFNLYGLLGYGHTRSINDGGNGNLPEISDWGFVWGAGVEFDLSDSQGDYIEHASYDRAFDGHGDQEKGWGLFIDYQRPWSDHDFTHNGRRGKVDLGMLSVGVTYDF
jgi:OOP family OmpA-OmpF porin